MNIIPQMKLFEEDNFDDLGDLERLQLVLSTLDDAKLNLYFMRTILEVLLTYHSYSVCWIRQRHMVIKMQVLFCIEVILAEKTLNT